MISKNKTSLASDMADTISSIKSLIVRSENAKLTLEMKELKKAYADLNAENGKLFVEDRKRNLNSQELTLLLKDVGAAIAYFSSLRVGKFKTEVTNLSRDALKNRQFSTLVDILERGS